MRTITVALVTTVFLVAAQQRGLGADERPMATSKASTGSGPAGSLVVFQQQGDVPLNKPIALSLQDGNGLKIAFFAKGKSDVGIRLHDSTTNKDLAPTGVKWTGGNSDYGPGRGDFMPVLYDVATMGRPSHTDDHKLPNPIPAFTSASYSSLTFQGSQAQVRDLVIYRGDDTEPPEAPADLAALAGADGVLLSWKPASDNAGTAWYVIARADGDGPFVKVGQTTGLSYEDKPPAAGSHRYRVLAVDFERNIGPWSQVAAVETTQAFPPAGEAPLVLKYPWLGDVPVTFVDRRAVRSDSLNYGEHIRAVHRSGAGKVKRGSVLFIGDGCTHTDRFGWGGGSSFCNRVMTLFPRCWVNDGGSWDPQREWTDPFMLKTLPAELAKKPEMCILLMGINSPHGTPSERRKVVEDVRNMVRMCEAAGAVTVVGDTTAYSWIEPVGSSEEALSDALLKMCDENRIPVIRIFDLYRNAQKAGAEYRALMGGPNGGKYAPGASFPQNELWYQSFENGMNARYVILREYLDQVLFALLDRPDPPSALPGSPRNLTGKPLPNRKIALAWEAPPAAAGPAAETYRVASNGEPIATVSEPCYVDQGLDESARVTYAIHALDKQGHASKAALDGAFTTLADHTPPAIIGVQQVGRDAIRIRFDEKLDKASAAEKANYRIDKGVTVTGASLDEDGMSVTLTAGGWSILDYTLGVTGVKDDSAAQNACSDAAGIPFHFELDAAILKDGWVRIDDRSPYIEYPANGTQVYVSFDTKQHRDALHHLGVNAGASASFTFTGTGIRWIGNRQSNQGLADVRLDNVLVAAGLDTYAATPEYQAVLFEKSDLPMGAHTIKITATNKKNPASSNAFVTLDAFDYAPNDKPLPPEPAKARSAP